MIDKDQIIKAQQEKIERIQKLQQNLHGIAMTGMLTLSIIGSKGLETAILENTLETIHNISHAIKDVLNGMSPKEAIEKNMTEDDEEEE